LSALGVGWIVTWGVVVAGASKTDPRAFWILATWLAVSGLALGIILLVVGESEPEQRQKDRARIRRIIRFIPTWFGERLSPTTRHPGATEPPTLSHSAEIEMEASQGEIINATEAVQFSVRVRNNGPDERFDAYVASEVEGATHPPSGYGFFNLFWEESSEDHKSIRRGRIADVHVARFLLDKGVIAFMLPPRLAGNPFSLGNEQPITRDRPLIFDLQVRDENGGERTKRAKIHFPEREPGQPWPNLPIFQFEGEPAPPPAGSLARPGPDPSDALGDDRFPDELDQLAADVDAFLAEPQRRINQPGLGGTGRSFGESQESRNARFNREFEARLHAAYGKALGHDLVRPSDKSAFYESGNADTSLLRKVAEALRDRSRPAPHTSPSPQLTKSESFERAADERRVVEVLDCA
jgi:hypothetical protein